MAKARPKTYDRDVRRRLHELFANPFCWFDKRPGCSPAEKYAALSPAEQAAFRELYPERYKQIAREPHPPAPPAAPAENQATSIARVNPAPNQFRGFSHADSRAVPGPARQLFDPPPGGAEARDKQQTIQAKGD